MDASFEKHVLIDCYEIRPAGAKGRGMFATACIPAGTVLDHAQLVFLKPSDYDLVKRTTLDNYTFEWKVPVEGEDIDIMAVAMSPCQFCNHSYTPNAGYQMDYSANTIIFQTAKDIAAGEEITVNYNGKLDDKSPLWFDVIDSSTPESAPVQPRDVHVEQAVSQSVQELSDMSIDAVEERSHLVEGQVDAINE